MKIATDGDLQIAALPKIGTGEYYTTGDISELWKITNEKTRLLNFNSNSQLMVNIVDPQGDDLVFYLGSLIALHQDLTPFYEKYLRTVTLSLANFQIIDSRAEESKSFNDLYSKYQKMLEEYAYKPKFFQEKSFLEILREISLNFTYDISSFEVGLSADAELLLIKQNEKGMHYLISGQSKDQIFYGFSGKKPGDFFSRKYSDPEAGISNLVNLFLSR